MFSVIFSFASTTILLNGENEDDKYVDLSILFGDYLFFFFMFIGLFISLAHEYSNKKQLKKPTFLLVLMSICISVSSTVLIWVLYDNNTIPVKLYYGLVLFTSVFSPGIVRYLLAYLPESVGKYVVKTVDKIGNKIVD